MTVGGRAGEPVEQQVPDDVQRLQEEIEQARDQLGDTVQQLAAKADVKSRARAKAATLAGRLKSTTARTGEQAAARTASARGQLASTTSVARQKVISAGQAGKGQLQRRAAPVRDAMPEPVRQTVARGASTARQRSVPLTVTAIVLVLGFLVIRQRTKR